MNAYEFICKNIDRTTKTYDENYKDGISIPLIPLPYAFTTPCAEGMFQEMYYWDTYFTNKCLLLLGREEQVLNNIKNMAHLLERFGKIPNGNRMHYIGRSQPPFFGLMMSDLMKCKPELLSTEQAYEWLEKEYQFWQTHRNSINGLNHYGCDLTDEEALGNVGYYQEIHTEKYEERTGIHLENTVKNGKNVIAECESGWDFSPRFGGDCMNCNPVDLNSLLYADELLLAKWAQEIGKQEKNEYYLTCAKERKEKILAYMRSEDGIFYDYNCETKEKGTVISCAATFPYLFGIDDDMEGFQKILKHLEHDYGVVVCKFDDSTFQWASPNSWAPMTYMVVATAKHLGLETDAKRLVEKYLLATDMIFEKTKRLWEKYNAKTGGMDVLAEYETPEMLGWSAGTYVAFYQYKNSGYRKLL